MDSKMNSTKKTVPTKVKTTKKHIKDTTKHKIIVGSIIVFLVLVVGAYIVYNTGLPAQVLSGASVAGENVSVCEVNYQFNKLYSMYYQYGLISSKDDLQKVYDTTTGQTYGEYLYDAAARRLQSIYLVNQEAAAAGYKAKSVDTTIDAYIKSIREYADTNKTTADNVLRSQYGRGTTVRSVEAAMRHELTAQEYTEYLKQTEYALTTDEMQAMYDAAPQDYDNVTFNVYYFASAADSTATADEQKTALADATALAQGVVDASTDPASFRTACLAAVSTAEADSFADDADPTLKEKSTKATVTSSQSEEVAAYLFEDGRTAGDKTVITTDAGAYAVYFQSRQADETPNASYRILTLNATDLEAAKTKLEGYKAQVTDEASFSALARTYSDNTDSNYKGGLVSEVTEESLTSSTSSDENTALKAWLFSGDRKAGDMVIIEGTDSVSLYYYQTTVFAWQAGLQASNATSEYNTWYTALAAEDGNGYSLNQGNIDFATY